MKRFYLANAKAEEHLDMRVVEARTAIERFAKGQPYTITTGRDFYLAHFARLGSWPAFTQEVATGIDFRTREPLFHAILVPAGPVGAGTAAIVESAIRAGKLCMAVRQDGAVARIVSVRCASQHDWQTGYRLMVDRTFA